MRKGQLKLEKVYMNRKIRAKEIEITVKTSAKPY